MIELDCDIWVVQKAANNFRVAIGRNALVAFLVVIIVVVEANRESLENRGREFLGMAAPLFDGVSFEKGFVKFTAEHFEGLVLEIFRVGDGLIAEGLDESLRFTGAETFSEKLVDCEKIDGEGKNASACNGFHAVDKWAEVSEAPDIIPDAFVVGIENVGTVAVDHDAGLRIALGVAVSGDVVARVPDFDLAVELFRELPRGDCAGEAGTDDFYMEWHELGS